MDGRYPIAFRPSPFAVARVVGRLPQLARLVNGKGMWMDSIVLSSAGFTVGPFEVPAFRLRAGECVCLHLSEAMDSPAVDQLIGILSGKRAVSEVRCSGRSRWAAPVRKVRHGLFGLFRPMRVADWLARTAGATPPQTQAILHRLSAQGRNDRLDRLAGTSRMLLSVEAAWLIGTQVIVWTTAGLDPPGREAVYQAVSSHFPRWSAIHLSFSFHQNGQRLRECFAGTRCLEVGPASASSPVEAAHPNTK